MRRVAGLLALMGLFAVLVAAVLPGSVEPEPEPAAAVVRKVRRASAPSVRVEPVAPVPPDRELAPAPVPFTHDPGTQAWVALDARARAFLATPLEPQVADDAGPDEEQDAFQTALDERLSELEALETELLEVAQDTSRPRRALEATVTLGELYAEMGASVEQLPVPSQLGPRAAARWSRDADARAAVHLDKARVLFDVASGQGALADPGLAPRVSAGRRASAPR